MIPAHCPGIFFFLRFLEVSFGFGQNLTISRRFFSVLDRSLTSVGGGGKVENCLHDPSTLSHFFLISQVFRFLPECSEIRCVQKPNAKLGVSLSVLLLLLLLLFIIITIIIIIVICFLFSCGVWRGSKRDTTIYIYIYTYIYRYIYIYIYIFGWVPLNKDALGTFRRKKK